jgi:[ribosomal protein S5]-alanine N-acetyltransferase
VADVRLETDRLILREIEEEDWPLIHRYEGDPAVCRFVGWGPNTEQQTIDHVKTLVDCRADEPRNRVVLGMVCKDSGDFIGAIGINRRSADSCQAEVGYTLRRDEWGRGYTTEAARAVIGFGFREWGLHRIHARCDGENGGSARVLEKCGMRREGHLVKSDRIRDEWRDELLYAILDEEWT